MATDPNRNETDGALDESRDDGAAAHTPGPPRPPRPGKRSKGSGRIPIPLPQNRTELGPALDDAGVGDPMEAAPGVDFAAAERDDPELSLLPARAKPPSVPEESFADVDLDSAGDRAPNAPLTPWRGIPSLQADPVEVTPRAASRGFSRDDAGDSEPKPTMVGKVPENLLELSGASEENTRAFTAPRELIELAKRERDEPQLSGSNASGEDSVRSRPQGGANDDDLDLMSTAAPNVPVDSVLPGGPESDQAPSVKRSFSSELEAAALPLRRAADSLPAVPSGHDVEIEPAWDSAPARRVLPIAVGSDSEPVPSDFRRLSAKRGWLVTVGFLVLVGIVIARWRELVVLFR